jgi:DNA-binding CsgD family transcriptional regulator
MNSLNDSSSAPARGMLHEGAGTTLRYSGPDRREERHRGAWVTLALDEIDYGTVVLNADWQIVHVNHRARVDLARADVVRRDGDRLCAANAVDSAPLNSAIEGALVRGLRRIVVLGDGERRTCVGVIPLPKGKYPEECAVLLITERASVCEALSVQWFALNHGLTPAEGEVLQSLCRGDPPAQVALRHGVAISTIRTQISTIRQKTGAQNLSALVRAIARLPPLMSALRMVS